MDDRYLSLSQYWSNFGKNNAVLGLDWTYLVLLMDKVLTI
jgi:hypothetical protein